MPDEEPENGAPDAPDGVFGNLPKSRPGARSPRRDGGPASERREDAAKTRAKRAERPAPPPPPPPAAEPAGPYEGAHHEPAERAPGAEQGMRGLEDLAWAGIAVAAKAATVGVRLASRALDSARKQTDRP